MPEEKEAARPGRGGRKARASASSSGALRGKVRPHDPFELIRWLALSQPDPRKALAELVQNSLDAGARTIRIVRLREQGVPCLRIWDDGEGVIPEMERPAALQYLATHIGHSRKRALSPQERLQLMTQGQYGIGLLGFWSLGQRMEVRSSFPGHGAHRLVLYRDRPEFVVERLRGRLSLGERFTEVVVSGLHPEASAALLGRRAADFLASELRGQLLAREVRVIIDDRMSRGRAKKLIDVKPPRFLGERIPELGEVAVPGRSPVRAEVYFASNDPAEAGRGPLAVYAAGTLVATGFHELAALGLDRLPWTDPRLTGMVDFPDLQVAPGSRRGVVVDEAAGAFVHALTELEPALLRALEESERRRTEQLDRSLVRDLQRAFRDFARQQPRWTMLPVSGPSDRAVAADAGAGRGAAPAPSSEGAQGSAPTDDPSEEDLETAAGSASEGIEDDETGATPDLLPPGPLAAVRIDPPRLRISVGSQRRLRAAATDATGRLIGGSYECAWKVFGQAGSLEPRTEGSRFAVFTAAGEVGEGVIEVEVRSEGRGVRAEAPVEVVEASAAAEGIEGIPSPDLVDEPTAPWRSRLLEERWQVNSGHRDFREVADRPALKLRYLATLLAKELVLRNCADLRLEQPLEQMIEVVAFADRRLGGPRGPRGRSGGAGQAP